MGEDPERAAILMAYQGCDHPASRLINHPATGVIPCYTHISGNPHLVRRKIHGDLYRGHDECQSYGR